MIAPSVATTQAAAATGSTARSPAPATATTLAVSTDDVSVQPNEARQLVRRQMPERAVVSVVEAVELREDDPARKRRQHPEDVDSAGAHDRQRADRRRQQVRNPQHPPSDDVVVARAGLRLRASVWSRRRKRQRAGHRYRLGTIHVRSFGRPQRTAPAP